MSTELVRLLPLRQWPLVRTQLAQGQRHAWKQYTLILRIAKRLGMQPHAFPVYTRHETALDRQEILRRKFGKVAKGLRRVE
jgi:hypothetical protein